MFFEITKKLSINFDHVVYMELVDKGDNSYIRLRFANGTSDDTSIKGTLKKCQYFLDKVRKKENKEI